METEHIECACHSIEHTIHLIAIGDNEVSMNLFLSDVPWYKRVWKAIKYVFGYKCIYGQFDEFIIDKEGANEFISFLSKNVLDKAGIV